MFIELFIALFSIFLMIVPGYISAKKKIIGENSLRELSAVHIKFIYPCLIISSLTISFNAGELLSLWVLPAGCFGIMLFGYLLGFIFIRLPIFGGSDERKSFHFQCVINNYSFIPMPIAYGLYGDKGVAAVIYASIGAETALWTLGLASLKGFSLKRDVLKHFLAPPLLALYFTITLIGISGYYSFDMKKFVVSDPIFAKIMMTIKTFGAATIPIAMIVCGARMALTPVKELNKKSVWILMFVRLVFIPLCAGIVIYSLPVERIYLDVLWIIAVMPTSVASILMSEIYGGDKDFVTATVISTHVASLISVPFLLNLNIHI
jgi:predicted permease